MDTWKRIRPLFAIGLSLLLWNCQNQNSFSPFGKKRGGENHPPQYHFEEQFVKQRVEIIRRQLVDAYYANKSACGIEEEELLKLTALYLGYAFDRPTLKEMDRACQETMAFGCKDPYVVYLSANIAEKMGNTQWAIERYRESIRGFEDSPYPDARTFAAYIRLADLLLEEKEYDQDIDDLYDSAVTLMVGSLSDGSFQKGEERFYLSNFTSAFCSSFPAAKRLDILDRFQQISDFDPWLMAMFKGLHYTEKAWEERGVDWAANTSNEELIGFGANLELAYPEFKQAWTLHPEWPEAAAELITVTMPGVPAEWGTPELWFARAQEVDAGWHDAYSSYIHTLLPRWGGSRKAILNFGRQCLDTQRFDTRIPALVLDGVEIVMEDIQEMNDDKTDDRDLYRQPDIKRLLTRYFDEALGQEEISDRRKNLLLSQKATICWAWGDLEMARSIIDELGPRFDSSYFKDVFLRSPDVLYDDIYPKVVCSEDIICMEAQKVEEGVILWAENKAEFDINFTLSAELENLSPNKEIPVDIRIPSRTKVRALVLKTKEKGKPYIYHYNFKWFAIDSP